MTNETNETNDLDEYLSSLQQMSAAHRADYRRSTMVPMQVTTRPVSRATTVAQTSRKMKVSK